jgi:outer membrane protein assembly factor BamB
MLSRRTALGLPLALPVALAACSTPKAKIIGHQIPVLQSQDELLVSPAAPAVGLPPMTMLADWPQALANAAHVPGNVAGPTGLHVAWSTSIGAAGGYRQPLTSPPIVAEGRVFTIDANGFVSALSLTDGGHVWRTNTRPKHATEQNIGGGIAYARGRLYVSTGFAELVAIDAGTGTIIWRQTTHLPPRTAPMVAAGLVAVIIQMDVLLTFDAQSGTPGWQFTGRVGDPPPAVVALTGAPAFADGIIVGGFNSGTLAALDAHSGTALWEQSFAASFGQASTLDLADIVAAPVIAGGVVYAVGLGNTAMAIDLHSGNKVWQHTVTGTNPFAVAGDFVFLLDAGAALWAIHADDGLAVWKRQLSPFHNMKKKTQPIDYAGPVLIGGSLMITNDRGEVILVDPLTGDLDRVYPLKSPIDIPPIAAAGLRLQLDRNAVLTAYS